MIGVDPPTFVVSTGRSGSLMLARVVAQLDGIMALHEPQPHLITEGYLHWKGSLSSQKAKVQIKMKRSALIEQVAMNGLDYFESSHYCSHFIPELADLYDARFIHLYRDGRAFVQSGIAHETWYGSIDAIERFKTWLRRNTLKPIGHYWHDHRLDPPASLKSRVEKLSWLWVEINEQILRELASLPHVSRFSLRLEDVGMQQIKELCSFLGRESIDNEAVTRMIEVASRRPNSAKARKKEKKSWTEVDEEQFIRIAGATMVKLGYSLESSAFIYPKETAG